VSRVAELWGDLGPRGRVAAIAGAVIAFVVLPLVLFAPAVRWAAGRSAAARGLTLTVGSVRPSGFGVVLRDVRFTSLEPGVVQGSAAYVRVPLLGNEVEVRGGFVAVSGSVDAVRKALRPPGAAPTKGSSGGGGRRVFAEGIAVAWNASARGDSPAQRLWGLKVDQRGPEDALEIDLVELSASGVRLEARGVSCRVLRGETRRLRELSVRQASARVEVDRLRAPEPKAKAFAPSPSRPPSPAVETERSLRTLLLEAARDAAAWLPEAPLTVGEVSASVSYQGEQLGFGPSRVDVSSDPKTLFVTWRPSRAGQAGATPLSLRLQVPRAADGPDPQLEVEGGPVSLGTLGVRDGDFGLFAVRDATLEAHLLLSLAPRSVRFSGSGRLANLSIHRPALSPEQLRGIRLGLSGRGEIATDGSAMALDDAEVTFGDVKLTANLRFANDLQGMRVSAKGAVPLASCGAMLSSIPEGLVRTLGGLKLDGVFSLGFELAYDTTDIEAMRVGLDVKNECRVTYAPAVLNPERFRTPWVREVKGADGSMTPIETGPGTDTWVAYENISRNMEIAVQVCEDGGFHRHRGFDFRAMEKAIKDNVRAGRFLRGASTISMQLAKNLYLGKEKTLARKIEEAVLTMLLEQELSKQQILELYLNVIEFGPGIYGIGPAARHYFNQPASELTLSQSLYLASILPDPTRQHFAPNGSLTPTWAAYIERLIHIAHKVKLISEEERDRALEERVAFREPADGDGLPSGELPTPSPSDPAGGTPAEAFGGPNGDVAPGP
jgi:monofunctional biosynthetic peptidoglycan transglycosylase